MRKKNMKILDVTYLTILLHKPAGKVIEYVLIKMFNRVPVAQLAH